MDENTEVTDWILQEISHEAKRQVGSYRTKALYSFPRARTPIHLIFEKLNDIEGRPKAIKSWGINGPSLEDVYRKIIDQAKDEELEDKDAFQKAK